MNEKLEKWYSQISMCDKLTITEAQELYKKVLNTQNEELKKLYMDRLILGTLYVVYKHIKNGKFDIFSSSSYDIDDIISTFTQIWIQKIKDGELLKHDRYIDMFSTSFYNEACDTLCSKDVNLSDIYSSLTLVAAGFEDYLEYKNNKVNETFQEYLYEKHSHNYYYRWSVETCYEVAKLIETYEKIYGNLNLEKDEDLTIGKVRTYNTLKLLMCLGLIEPIKEESSVDEEFESKMIHDLNNENLIEDVDSIIQNKRRREMVHLRFGLDDNKPQTLEEIANQYGVSRDRVRQILAKEIRRVKFNRVFYKKYNGE